MIKHQRQPKPAVAQRRPVRVRGGLPRAARFSACRPCFVPAKQLVRCLALFLVLGPWLSPGLGSSFAATVTDAADPLPWAAAGLDAEAAAAHLLDRFAFGPRPGDVEAVVALGHEAWLDQQLRGIDDPVLDARLAKLPSVDMPLPRMISRYPADAVVRRMMERDGVALPSVDDPGMTAVKAEQALRQAIRAYARERRLRPISQLVGELYTQKLARAVMAENQLREVLVDFWFNHFNVSVRDTEVRPYVVSYERDAIRPHVLGHFRDLLEATARHPAMLFYLDNAQSGAEPGMPRSFDLDAYRWRLQRRRIVRQQGTSEAIYDADATWAARPKEDRRPRGLNENYARELLELHTLGVEGGYSEDDVIEVARAFTGWSVVPPAGAYGEPFGKALDRLLSLPGSQFVRDGLFLFRADLHDSGEKSVLGQLIPEGGGIEDGEAVIDLLVQHPSTARHIARKLAIRFVQDEPPEALVAALAQAYLENDGSLSAMMRTLARSPHFWADSARRRKIKSPFELAASALRGIRAEVGFAMPLMRRLARLGQDVYAYPAPSGFPDRADAWVSSGALLGRMNLGLDLVAGHVPGIQIDLGALDDGPEPESILAALDRYARVLLPGRDIASTVESLRPLATDPAVVARVAQEAAALQDLAERTLDTHDFEVSTRADGSRPAPPSPVITRVVGLILGSPEFQRR